MKINILSLTGLVILSLFACKASSDKNEQLTPPTDHPHTTYTAENGHTIGMNVALNHGAKWEANFESTRGIDVMRGHLIAFSTNPTVEDYRTLHNQLAIEYQHILQRCTMTGEALKQLNNYLAPLKGMIDKTGSENLKSCNALLPDLKEYVLKYSHFFFS